MVEFAHVITDPQGLHARPVVQVISVARGFRSSVTVTCGGRSVSGLDLMGLMGLDSCVGDVLVVRVEGPDEAAAAAAIKGVLP